MKKTIKLTESDLMRLVKRIMNESKKYQTEKLDEYFFDEEGEEKSLVDEYIDMMDGIVDEYSDEDDYENMLGDLGSLVTTAENDQDLSDEDIDKIYDYYDEITRSLDFRP
jgi:hypothetical protein